MNMLGIDLSSHNGSVDFEELKKAGNAFVILRAGYGADNDNQKDSKFNEYYLQARKAGLHVGAYHYSYALDVDGAKREAESFLKWVKGYSFDMPVYIDMEDADGYKRLHGMPSNKTLCDICRTFCNTLEKAGYFSGIYASESWLNNQLKSLVDENRYTIWCANWGTNTGSITTTVPYLLHQFTSNYILKGKRYDRNICYFNFPILIVGIGFNGYTGKKSNEEIAKEVWYGLWGNGEQRKVLLKAAGYDYEIIQAIVNDMKPNITKGSKVRVKSPINYDTGVEFLVYYDVYDVIQVTGDRAVIGIGNVVTAPVSVKNLELV